MTKWAVGSIIRNTLCGLLIHNRIITTSFSTTFQITVILIRKICFSFHRMNYSCILHKGPYNQSYLFSPAVHVWVWELDHKETWGPKNWCFELCCWRRLLRDTWTSRRSNQSILKESILNIHWRDWCWGWSSNTWDTRCEESQLIGKDPDAGKDWR